MTSKIAGQKLQGSIYEKISPLFFENENENDLKLKILENDEISG